MALVYRPLGYTGTTQRLVVTADMGSTITAYLWGGGGGGGGSDSPGAGGNGQAGGYSELTFSITAGDVIDISVGGAGQGGQYGFNRLGGAAGGSYVTDQVFNTRTSTFPFPVYPVTNGGYCTFLNQTGIWNTPGGGGTPCVATIPTFFPATGNYIFTSSVDNYGSIFLDNVKVIDMPYQESFRFASLAVISVTAGTHNVKIEGNNIGGPGSIGLTIAQNQALSFSGGPGGDEVPWSGAGGGGGGATVIFKNGVMVGVAGGGGGGGGGGHLGQTYGASAPGPSGQAISASSGMAGQSNSSDGAGGGGGGGGLLGGNGGAVFGGDQGAYGGVGGTCMGSFTQVASGTTPYQGQFYAGNTALGGAGARPGGAVGGSGGPGYAVLAFNISGQYVKDSGTWKSISKAYVKQAGAWKPVKTTYVKQNGLWKPIITSQGVAPLPTPIGGEYGIQYRNYGENY